MIVVKIELHSARTGAVSEIGRMHIANIGHDPDPSRGDYVVQVLRRGFSAFAEPGWEDNPKHVVRVGKVLDYPRLSYNVWRLVARAVLSAFPEERGK